MQEKEARIEVRGKPVTGEGVFLGGTQGRRDLP